jgi:hypothetical protein
MAGSGSLTAGLLSPQLFASMLAADGAAVLAAHLDAMDIAGASGDAVATWASTIAGGPSYTPISTAPTLGAKNGLRFVQDNGVYSAMVTTTDTEKASRRVFIVARPDAVGSLAQRPLYGTSGSSSEHIGARFNVGNLAVVNLYGASQHTTPTVPVAGSWALFEFDLRPDGFTIFIDGVQDLAVTATQGAITLNTLLGGVHNGNNYQYYGAISMVTEYDTSVAVMSVNQVAAARSAGMFRVALLNSPELSYSFSPEDEGSFGAGFTTTGTLPVGTLLTLAGTNPLTNVTTVGSVVRTGGAKDTASVYFATNADYLGYSYTQAPVVDAVGFALSIMIPDDTTTGRIAHTTAVGSTGFLLEVIAGVLWATADDGDVEITASRTIAAGEFGVQIAVAAAIGPYGLLLCAGDDAEGDVVVEDRLDYVGPTADDFLLGGAGITIYGGALYSPEAVDAAGLITLKADTASGLAWSVSMVVDEDASTGATFSDITDGGVDYRLAVFDTGTGSLVVTDDVDVEYLVIGGGGAGATSIFEGGPGGGAGGLVTNYGGAPLAVAPGSYAVAVGAGSATAQDARAANGGDSSFAGVVAVGGSAGTNRGLSLAGGSSGGNGRSAPGAPGAASQGNTGGLWVADPHCGGGGGGAGAPGEASDDGAGVIGGKGGDGLSCAITGAAVYYAGGGGSGNWINTGRVVKVGGVGGGGNGAGGANGVGYGDAGVDGLGGGGGGGYRWYLQDPITSWGGKGGDGVVIVRWPL